MARNPFATQSSYPNDYMPRENGEAPKATPKQRKEEMEAVRLKVKADIASKFKNDSNPVTQFLLRVGVLEDMEVFRRLIVDAGDNSSVYIYNNKLSALKSYVQLVKETVSIQEKQAKVSSINSGDEDDADGIEISLIRE